MSIKYRDIKYICFFSTFILRRIEKQIVYLCTKVEEIILKNIFTRDSIVIVINIYAQLLQQLFVESLSKYEVDFANNFILVTERARKILHSDVQQRELCVTKHILTRSVLLALTQFIVSEFTQEERVRREDSVMPRIRRYQRRYSLSLIDSHFT